MTEEEDVENICDDNSDSDNDQENADETCSICKEFGKNEVWYRCRGCGRWAHEDCSGADSPEQYLCDYCNRKQGVTRRLDL